MPTINSTSSSEGCMRFTQSHFVYARDGPVVVQIAEISHPNFGNMTVHPCDRRATESDLIALQSGNVFVVKDTCASVDWTSPKKTECGKYAVKYQETPVDEFCEQSPTYSLCDEYAPGVVSPSTGVNELEKLSDSSAATNTTRSPSPSPSSARRVSSLVSLAIASLTVVAGVM